MKRIFVGVILCLFGLVLNAQTNAYRAEAMFVYNFTKLIHWPEEVNYDNFIIEVYSCPELADELNKYIQNKKVSNKTIKINEVIECPYESDADILFVPYNKTNELYNICKRNKNPHLLIIGEGKKAINYGAVLSLFIDGGKMKFYYSERNAGKSHLNYSQQLISLAGNDN